MKNSRPSPHAELSLRIMHLKSEKFDLENDIRNDVKVIATSFNPLNLVINSLHEIGSDEKVQYNLTAKALKFGTNFLLFKVLKRFGGPVGLIGTAVIGAITSKYISKKTPKLVERFGRLIHREDLSEEEQEIEFI